MQLTYTLRDGIITRTGHKGPPYPLQKMSRDVNRAKQLAADNLRAVIAHSGPSTAVWDCGNGQLEELQP